MINEKMRVTKRLRNLEALIRLLLAVIIALLIGLCSAVTAIYEYETDIKTVELVQK